MSISPLSFSNRLTKLSRENSDEKKLCLPDLPIIICVMFSLCAISSVVETRSLPEVIITSAPNSRARSIFLDNCSCCSSFSTCVFSTCKATRSAPIVYDKFFAHRISLAEDLLGPTRTSRCNPDFHGPAICFCCM